MFNDFRLNYTRGTFQQHYAPEWDADQRRRRI